MPAAYRGRVGPCAGRAAARGHQYDSLREMPDLVRGGALHIFASLAFLDQRRVDDGVLPH
ncbi:hypothetical protein PUN4_180072 [Paraburkholderia unamae]|nr:hypothetical protein PUN4_180072 [Paraburkholderia unamae]